MRQNMMRSGCITEAIGAELVDWDRSRRPSGDPVDRAWITAALTPGAASPQRSNERL